MTEDAFVDSVSHLSFLASATDIPLFVPISQIEHVHIQNAQKQTFLRVHSPPKDSFPDFFPRQRFFWLLFFSVSKITLRSRI